MFKASVNPYDEIVAKATDEKETTENWALFSDIWDRVNTDTQEGAHNCILSIQKRMLNRNANVQIYCLSLVESLVKNCGEKIHKEVSSKAFCQTLTRMVNDRSLHAKVKKTLLSLIYKLAQEYQDNITFDIIVELYENLKKQNFEFEEPTPEHDPSKDAVEMLRRKEEEDLRRALEESAILSQDSLRRSDVPASYRDEASGSGTRRVPDVPTGAAHHGPRTATSQYSARPGAQSQGYTPQNPASATQAPVSNQPEDTDAGAPQRVKALYDFTPTGPDELAFRQGDIIKVVECIYSTWWKGELQGRVGIFPVVYVEVLPDLARPANMQEEARKEASVFAEARAIDDVLTLLQTNPTAPELPALYARISALRPRVLALIEKYNWKQAELKSMNDKLLEARLLYDQGQPGYGAQIDYVDSPPGNTRKQSLPTKYDPRLKEYEAQLAQYEIQLEEYKRGQLYNGTSPHSAQPSQAAQSVQVQTTQSVQAGYGYTDSAYNYPTPTSASRGAPQHQGEATSPYGNAPSNVPYPGNAPGSAPGNAPGNAPYAATGNTPYAAPYATANTTPYSTAPHSNAPYGSAPYANAPVAMTSPMERSSSSSQDNLPYTRSPSNRPALQAQYSSGQASYAQSYAPGYGPPMPHHTAPHINTQVGNPSLQAEYSPHHAQTAPTPSSATPTAAGPISHKTLPQPAQGPSQVYADSRVMTTSPDHLGAPTGSIQYQAPVVPGYYIPQQH